MSEKNFAAYLLCGLCHVDPGTLFDAWIRSHSVEANVTSPAKHPANFMKVPPEKGTGTKA